MLWLLVLGALVINCVIVVFVHGLSLVCFLSLIVSVVCRGRACPRHQRIVKRGEGTAD